MIKHAAVYLIAYALPGLLGFVAFGIYTRLLTPAEYGIYSVGASVSFLIGNICYGWIRFSVARFQAEAHETNFIPFGLLCFSITTIMVAPIVIMGEILLVDQAPLVVGAVLAMTVAQALFEITQEMQRARHQSVAFTRASVSRSLLSFTLSVSAAYVFARGAALLLGIATGFATMALVFFLGHGGFASLKRSRLEDLEGGLVRRFLRYGMPLTLSGLVFAGNSTLVRILVGASLGAEVVGQFGAALDLTNTLCGILAGSVSSIMSPLAIGAYRREGLEGAQREMRAGGVLFLGILMPTIAGLAIVADPFANVIAGAAFEGTISGLLPLLALSRGLSVFAQFYLHLGFQIVERPMRQVVCGSVTILTNVLLNLLLTRYFGLMGAVWALVISDVIGVIVSLVLLRPVFPLPVPMKQLGALTAIVTAMAIGCLFVRYVLASAEAITTLGATVTAGVLLYGSLIYAFDVGKVRSRKLIMKGAGSIANVRT